MLCRTTEAFRHRPCGRLRLSDLRTVHEATALHHANWQRGCMAAYCKRAQMRLADYATKASGLISAAPRGAGYPRSVAATFNLAITEAVAECQAAEPLMAYLAHCAPERVPMTLVEGALEDESERMNALAALAEVSLLRHDPFEDGTRAVTVHRLLQAVARYCAPEKSLGKLRIPSRIIRVHYFGEGDLHKFHLVRNLPFDRRRC